jgi:hypothetical protein
MSGCSDDGYGPRYAVSGTVTYNKQPVKQGSITFTPEDVATGKVATGVISEGGYALTTFQPGDGAKPGRYKVSVTANEVDLGKVKAAATAGGGAAYDEALVAKAQARRKSSVPKKYNTPVTSNLGAEVKEERNSIDFDLTD